MNIDHYRSGFDVPFPLLPNGVATRVAPAELQAAQGRRHLLLSFKGDCSGPSRSALKALHNGKEVVIACSESEHAVHYDYKTLMLSSVFAAAPAGRGLHSYRLAEAMFLGAIPVIMDDKVGVEPSSRLRLRVVLAHAPFGDPFRFDPHRVVLPVAPQLVLPFCSVLDWRAFSVRISSRDIPRLPELLRQISPAQVASMQRRLAEVKKRYFLSPFTTALSLIRLRVSELNGRVALKLAQRGANCNGTIERLRAGHTSSLRLGRGLWRCAWTRTDHGR